MASVVAQYDLTPTLSKHLDPHLVIPLLEFLESRVGEEHIYDPADMIRARIELMKHTNMMDYLIQEYNALKESVPEEFMKKRARILEELQVKTEEQQRVLDFFQADDVKNAISEADNTDSLYQVLIERFGFDPGMLDLIYNWAKFTYECGNYTPATEFLDLFRSVAPSNHPKQRDARWGKAAGEILGQDWDAALADLTQLKQEIDDAERMQLRSDVDILNERAWLLHWALYVFFNHKSGLDTMAEWCFPSERDRDASNYMNVIQTLCPHILRYLTIAVLTNRRKRHLMDRLIEVIKQEAPNYRDPVTDFVYSLFVEYDFDKAQRMLKECEALMRMDFFLIGSVEENDIFLDSARQYIFETYCRIHSRISIPVLSKTLNLEPEDAERWIADVIRNARLDAKIDAIKGEVQMGIPAISSYHMLIEKTKTLSLRTQQMVNQVDKKAAGGRNKALYEDDAEQRSVA